MEQQTKICSKCQKPKSVDDFHKRLDGYQSRCKDCISEWYTNKYETDPEFRQGKLDQYAVAKTQEGFLVARSQYLKDRYDNNKDRYRDARYQLLYEITLEDYNWLWNLQNGLCALCLRPEKSETCKHLAVDHDHNHPHDDARSGCAACIRGLICWACNHRHLPWLEQNPHLQNDFVRGYLASRPFLQKPD